MKRDNTGQTLHMQADFAGGMNEKNPGENQYASGKNIIIRGGRVETRGGIRQYLSADAASLSGFYFNEDAEKFNDATHTGFWFPFDFVTSAFGSAIQGAEIIRLSIHDKNKVIFATGGAVYVYEDGYLTSVSVTPALTASEQVDFEQANDKVYLFHDGHPLYWDGTATGFVVVPDAGVGDDIPHFSYGVYHAGRMWGAVADDVSASAALDFTEWDLTNRSWGIASGEGEQGVIVYPFHEDTILCFKKRRVDALTAVNAIIESGADMADYVYKVTVSTKTGALAREAIVTIGEDVWYLGYGGIYSLARNQENKLMLDPVAVSEPVQSWIDRIHWSAASAACAAVHDNYVLFAVPVDGAATNNAVLVFDRLAGGGRGAWVGVWLGTTLKPVKFMHDNEKLIFLSSDGRVREMFTHDPWDSEDAFDDVEVYASGTAYNTGDLAKAAADSMTIYRCIQAGAGHALTDTDYWEAVGDPYHAHDIESELESRQFTIGETPSAPGRAEVLFRHIDPKVSVAYLSRDYGTEKEVYADQEYPITEWDIVADAFDITNDDLNFHDPHRKDYSVEVGTGGLYADSTGIWGGIKETHSLRFIPIMQGQRSCALRLTNSRGKIELLQMGMLAEGGLFAARSAA